MHLKQLLEDLLKLEGSWHVQFATHSTSGFTPFTLDIKQKINPFVASGSSGVGYSYELDVTDTDTGSWSKPDLSGPRNRSQQPYINSELKRNLFGNSENRTSNRGHIKHVVLDLLIKHICQSNNKASMVFNSSSIDPQSDYTLLDRFYTMVPHQYIEHKPKKPAMGQPSTFQVPKFVQRTQHKEPSAGKRRRMNIQSKKDDEALSAIISGMGVYNHRTSNNENERRKKSRK